MEELLRAKAGKDIWSFPDKFGWAAVLGVQEIRERDGKNGEKKDKGF